MIRQLEKKQPDSLKINTLIRLAEYNILKTGEDTADLDSAKTYIDLAFRLNSANPYKTCTGRILLTQGYLLREKNQRKAGKQTIENAILTLSGIKDEHNLGLAYYEIAQYYNYSVPAEMKFKLHYIGLSVNLFSSSRNLELKAFALKMLADLHNINGESDKALIEAKLSLATYQAIDYSRLQGVFELIGGIYFQQSDFLQAVNYHLRALKTALAEQDTAILCQINNGLGMTYMRLKDYRKAIRYFKNAILLAERTNDRSTIISLVFNVAESYLSLGETKEALAYVKTIPKGYLQIKDPSADFAVALMYLNIYSGLKDFSQTDKFLKLLINVVNLPQTNNTYKSYIYSALIKYSIASKQYASASFYLKRNESVLTLLKNPAAKDFNYKVWFKLDTLEQNYKIGVKHLLLHNKLADSLLMESQQRDLKKITSFYETTQRENAIKLLQAQGTLRETQLKHEVYSRKWALGFAIVLFFLLIILIDRYRVKQRMNRILKKHYSETRLANQTLAVEKSGLLAENDNLLTQKEWLLTEIHHRVKNNLHTVVSLLESQAFFLKNDALRAIEKSQHRIYAMSLIHQKIYSDENLKTVDISGFVPELIRYLKDSYGVHLSIQFHIDIDPIRVGVMQAIPLALIINEVLTNSMQHAFRQKESGSAIKVTINRSGDKVTLVISDNGVGIDVAVTRSRSGSLGLVLINGLSEDLDAFTQIENNNGTKVSVSFISDLSMADRTPENIKI
ncbi:histidine kinase dimerization/phosphoacceptor domain -containing protein [Mucilaginibacter sp. UYP25]|uniref:histidine kinase dimerization/phosphoacceptor domain -containing protein n=1 Tax=Mucilaginibacter sp. UYP25 TaxID=3156349 RepID=UPI0033971E7A